jgi:outer membrane protein TolC
MKPSGSTARRGGALAAMVTLIWVPMVCAQNTNVTASAPDANTGAPLTLTLQDALTRARANEPQYRAALTQYGVARQQAVQARAGLLPNVNYNAEFLYTQGNGTSSGRFIAANGVHEYVSEANVHQALSLQSAAEYRLARAQEALAKANAEIATRGLVVTVTQAYYGAVIAQRKYATAQRAAAEATHFMDISQKLEKGGEVAHADSIKAQIQAQQQQRAMQDAQLEMDRSRLELAVMIFPNFNQDFTTVDDLDNLESVPTFEEAEAHAGRENPQLRAALASMNAANQQVAASWNGFLPSLGLDYFYGIDANQFAANGRFDPRLGRNLRNLGYAATATLQLPIWNWGAGHAKLKSAHLEQQQARVELSFAQRKMVADLKLFYAEAQTSRTELDSLRQSADLAAESLRLTTLRYQAGEATALEVVDAQNTLTLSQNAFADGQLRFRLAMASLQTLTGQF